MELREIAERLYSLSPDEFTDARKAAVAAAPELAGDIKAMRKPSTAAWLVNLLAREEPDHLEELFDVGTALREAQHAMAGDELRRLSKERHEVIGRLGRDVSRHAAAAGYRPSDTVLRDVMTTLDAAVTDEQAAAAVRSGRLVRSLVPSGFDPVDLDGAVAVPGDLPGRPAGHPQRPRLRAVKNAPATKTTSGPQQRALDEARAMAAVAERAVVKTETALNAAGDEMTRAHEKVDEAKKALHDANARLAQARRHHEKVTRERDEAVKERDAARQALAKAEADASHA